jgi:hypothetical protein
MSTSIALKDQLKDDTLSLEEKLAAIDAAMASAMQQAQDDAAKSGISTAAPFDPADLTICDSCQ